MLNRPKSRQISKRIVLGFPLLVLLSVGMVWQSIDSVRDVSDRAERLVGRHIPELREIAALQDDVNRHLLALHKYYATLELPRELSSGGLDDHIGRHLAVLRAQGRYADEVAALEPQLEGFRQVAGEFHKEMQSGRDRNWDLLREYLSRANSYASLANGELQAWNALIRRSVTRGGEETMQGVARLNILQLGFAFVVVFVIATLMAFLYARIRDQSRLYHVAHHDALTGLPNRSSMQKIASELMRDEVELVRKSVMWLSLDRIALVSGTYGHDLGDQLLKAFSRGLEKLLEESPFQCCLFTFERANWVICVTEDEDYPNASQLLLHVERFTQRPLQIDGRDFNVACSIGVAHYPEHGNTLTGILRKADTARRVAVGAGGNTHRLYHVEMTRDAEHFLAVETGLRSALKQGTFELHYQPKLDSRDGRVHGAEALLRWRHEGRYMSPARFIPVAEQAGLVKAIGEWVLQRACEQWVTWHAQGVDAPPIAVNISAQQFQDAEFPALVQRILERTGMPPCMLELEITEEAANVRPDAVVETMGALKQVGVTLALDDFGTGYSSLAYLKRFPLDVLKIDRAFIRRLGESAQDLAIVRMIVEMAHELGFVVLAEGVESELQWQLLRAMQCDQLQGYLFSRALDTDAFLSYLDSVSTGAGREAG